MVAAARGLTRPHCTTCSATAKIKPTPNTIAAMMMPWTNGCIARFAGFDLALALIVAAWQWRQQRQDHDHQRDRGTHVEENVIGHCVPDFSDLR